jgi:hypothetical protein
MSNTPPESKLAPDLLDGAQAIADYLGFGLRETNYALQQGQIPARKRGRLWVGSKSELAKHFHTPSNLKPTATDTPTESGTSRCIPVEKTERFRSARRKNKTGPKSRKRGGRS